MRATFRLLAPRLAEVLGLLPLLHPLLVLPHGQVLRGLTQLLGLADVVILTETWLDNPLCSTLVCPLVQFKFKEQGWYADIFEKKYE